MKHNIPLVLDVGASVGLFAGFMAARSPKALRVVAFEPLASSAAQIPRLPNLRVESLVIASETSISPAGQVHFFETQHPEFSGVTLPREGREIAEDVWSFETVENLRVVAGQKRNASTLASWLSSNNEREVLLLKVDTQGSDLEVVESLGEYLSHTQIIIVEVPYSVKTGLYKSNVDLKVALSWFQEQGFLPVRIVPNGGGECNLIVINSAILSIEEYFILEAELGLDTAPTIKIGAHRDMLNWGPLKRLLHTVYRKFKS